ncbi:MAG: hypothetical protein ABJQ71_11500 [Roseibium sp.]
MFDEDVKLALTVEEAAKKVGVTEAHILEALQFQDSKVRHLRGVYFGDLFVIPVVELEDYLLSRLQRYQNGGN